MKKIIKVICVILLFLIVFASHLTGFYLGEKSGGRMVRVMPGKPEVLIMNNTVYNIIKVPFYDFNCRQNLDINQTIRVFFHDRTSYMSFKRFCAKLYYRPGVKDTNLYI